MPREIIDISENFESTHKRLEITIKNLQDVVVNGIKQFFVVLLEVIQESKKAEARKYFRNQ